MVYSDKAVVIHEAHLIDCIPKFSRECEYMTLPWLSCPLQSGFERVADLAFALAIQTA